jgi:hypothetical protein
MRRRGAFALAATLATGAALGASTLPVGGTDIARGEPSCSNPPSVFALELEAGPAAEEGCRQANAAISGREHQGRTYWTQVAGAAYPQQAAPEDSATPFDVDLFSVRLRNSREGLAGGAVCKQPGPAEQVEDCVRVPVIYATDEDNPWHEAYRSTEPGYVGAIAWIGRGRALAVGGTGSYPDREPNAPGDEWTHEERIRNDGEQGAGDARAWYFHDGAWEEISDRLPEEMRGLSALDIWIGREPDGEEWGLAGAYGQIWEWEGGRFTGQRIDRDSPGIGAEDPEWAVVDGPLFWTRECTGFGDLQTCTWQPGRPPGGETSDPNSDPNESSSPDFFHYRVREIRIAPDRTQKRVIAFTSGCCGPDEAGGSRRIEYRPQPRRDEAGVSPDDAPAPEQRPRWLISSDDTYGDSVYSFALEQSRFLNFNQEPDEFGEPQPSHGAPIWEPGETVIASAEAGREASSETSILAPEPRFVASDGDVEKGTFNNNMPVTGNGIPDWKVGEAPPSDPELRGLGVLATTVTENRPEYGGIRPHCNLTPDNEFVITVGDEVQAYWGDGFSGIFWDPQSAFVRVCRVEQIQGGAGSPQLDPDGPLRTRESGVQAGPSYTVNAIDMLDDENVGYAVGDRGAILRFGSPPQESDPPSLGSRRPAELAELSPYDEHRPAPAGEVGEVPAAATQPREQLDEPRMVRSGSPDGNEIGTDLPAEDVGTIVMSRDGSEGWAIGPTPESSDEGRGGVMTLHRYEGGQWTRCDPVGMPELGVEADPACADLAEIYGRQFGGGAIKLDVAARVPLEYDSDPTNDDEFEVIAVGSPLEQLDALTLIPTIVRYRDGRWRLEPFEVRSSLREGPFSFGLTATSLACTGPEECWLTGEHSPGGLVLRRFDGERWIDCSRANTFGGAGRPVSNPEACGDLGNRLTRISNDSTAGRFSLAGAGERVYLAGVRLLTAQGADRGTGAPLILYKDHGPDEQWRAEDGGHDPGFHDPGAPAGVVDSLAVVRRPDGRYEGWAVGAFEAAATLPFGQQARVLARWPLLRLDPESGEWRPHRVRDAAYDYLGARITAGWDGTYVQRQATLPGEGAEPGRAYIGTRETVPSSLSEHLLAFNPGRERWELAEKPGTAFQGHQRARPIAVAPDNRGGIWAAFGTGHRSSVRSGQSETYYYNYTRSPPRELFSEAANPLTPRERPTGFAGAPDGSLWISTNAATLYRYDRLSGWERASIPGWDPGRVVTRPSAINAVAVGPDGAGLAVGEAGRIAEIGSERVRLAAGAGSVCAPEAAEAPCGTSFDLQSADVAPDGSALVGGEKLALLWRPAGGELRRIPSPDANPTATITGIAMPSATRAWLALSSGQLFAGVGDGASGWHWRLENTIDVHGIDRPLNEDRNGEPLALGAIAVDASGHGFAVGDRGVVLERRGEGPEPWRRVDAGVTEKLTSVALPRGGGSGALIGGDRGLILTLTEGRWRVARAGDQLRPDDGYVAGLALLPGYEDGQVEAWALTAPQPADFRLGVTQLLHYTSAPAEPLLDPAARGSRVLPDAPSPREGELSFAAFGRSDCHLAAKTNLIPCPPLENGTEAEQTLLRRVRDELLARSKRPGGPQFAIFTGDAYDTGGSTGVEPLDQNSRLAGTSAVTAHSSGGVRPLSWTGGEKFRRFNEQITDFLPDRDLPTFAAVGARDLSEARACGTTGVSVHCVENRERPRAGENLAWRQAMEHAPAPWGGGDRPSAGSLSFEPLPDSESAIRTEDAQVDPPVDEPIRVDPLQGEEIVVEDPDGGGPAPGAGVAPQATVRPPEPIHVPAGGASTHYAADLVRDGERTARLIVVDTSPGSLAGADPIQQPIERDGGQRAWLESVLCIRGSLGDAGQCTREPAQQAIVVSSTPTYSYGPTAPDQTQLDAVVFESILLRHGANAVVSGRLGWNGRYWALAPGLHEPCPGQGYVPDHQAPEAGQARVCGNEVSDLPGDAGKLAEDAQGQVDELLGAGGAGALPFVVASGAGGRFDEFAERGGQADAAQGFWHGYTLVRLHPSGDARKTVVEQRPVLDWIGVDGKEHVLRAGRKLTLRGRGREPLGAPLGQIGSGRFDEISTAAITHRFELLEADPSQPWLPKRDAGSSDDATEIRSSASQRLGEQDPCGPYLCLDPKVATMDDQSGQVRAGNGNYPRTYAVAQLSAGERSATYPLVFEPRASFGPTPPPPPAPVAVPPPPPPPAPANPTSPSVNLPAAPVLPVLTTQALAPPPVPPSPPTFASQAPLDLNLAPSALDVSPPTAVTQPPTPPVNPAPPSGARREARQRQAAAQKSGADSSEGAEETQDAGGDMAQSPPTDANAASRHDFTALTSREQPSAWARDALLGAGLGIAALLLALGVNTARPTPRRREPELPAPAWARDRRR